MNIKRNVAVTQSISVGEYDKMLIVAFVTQRGFWRKNGFRK